MRSTFLAFMTTLAFVAGAGIAWQQWGGERRSSQVVGQTKLSQDAKAGSNPTRLHQEVANRTSKSRRAKHDPFADSDSVDSGKSADRVSLQELLAVKLPDSLMQQTSWQDPFRHKLWNTERARLDEEALVFEDVGRAIFLRSYSRMMAEFHISSSRETTGADDREPLKLKFDVELFKASQDEGIAIRFSDGECRVELHDGKNTPRVLRSHAINDDSHSGHVRVNATPNRIMVGWNGRLLINVARPSSIVKDQLYFQLINHSHADQPGHENGDKDHVVISDMRIEGE